jgi:hypothetical protein
MLDAITAIKAFSSLIGLLKGHKAVLPKNEERDRRLQGHVVDALRALYFAPKGILSLLHDVVNGEELSDGRIQQALGDFNDREWAVTEALQRIDFCNLRGEHGLSLARLRVLEQLRYGKMNLRQAVQDEVNLYGQDGTKPKKAAAKRLITAIENLNSEIEEIEAIVNSRARNGFVHKPRPAKKRATAKTTPAARKKTSQKAAR